MMRRFALVASALPPFVVALTGLQHPVQHILTESENTHFKCELPPLLDPPSDGLPAAQDLFSGEKALKLQVERHSAIVRVPSISYDDNGEPLEDPRWEVFYTLHKTFELLYPNV
jgi:Gly-Xaa carboxypeptidase